MHSFITKLLCKIGIHEYGKIQFHQGENPNHPLAAIFALVFDPSYHYKKCLKCNKIKRIL